MGVEITITQQPGPLAGEPIRSTHRDRYGRYEVIGPIGSGGIGVVLEAHDPTLDRKVALKLLHPDHGDPARAEAQLALEAQAMARLAHPNVVTVFEVDRAGDQVYIAMELVTGTTLRGWLAERPRRWHDILEMFVAAGRGLAAAHAAGLVHRDFKPDNVLIGRDGRPRVSDFGLVGDAGTAAQLTELAARDRDTTYRGSVAGTPAYMSAEQWAGARVDARSDQFAFCVALWEALCNCHPFASGQAHELRAAVVAGALTEPPHRRAPRWVFAMLRRGLAVDPAARWPDAATLLAALTARAQTGRRWRIAGLVAVAAIVPAVAMTVVLRARVTAAPCAPPTARLAAVWSPARGRAVRDHLVAIDPAQGADRFARIAAALDAGARGWSDLHVAACRATRVDGSQSDAVLDRRMECLDRWLVELETTIAVAVKAADRPAVDLAAYAAATMSPLEACADARALAQAPLPAGAAERATAIALGNRTIEIAVARRADQLDGLERKATELVAAARALGHAPTLAAALVVEVRVFNELGKRSDSEPILRELVEVAPRAHDDRAEAYGWMKLATFAQLAKGKTAEALALLPAARAAVLRAGEPIDLYAEYIYSQAIILDRGGRSAEGLAALRDVRHRLEQAGAAAASSPLAERLTDVLEEIAISYGRADNLDASIAAYREALAQRSAVFGAGSAQDAFVWSNLSGALARAGRLDDALAAVREAVRIREDRVGDSVVLAKSLGTEADIMYELGRWNESLALDERALAMERTRQPNDVSIAITLLGYGNTLSHLHRYAEAARSYDEGIAVFDRTGGKNINLGILLQSRGDLAAIQGRCGDGLTDYARALQVLEEHTDPTSSWLRNPLVGQGACLVRLHRAAEALPVLNRALGCKSGGKDAVDALLHAYLGRALVDTGRDVPGGLAMARAARPAIAASPEIAGDELPELDRWLAAHGTRSTMQP